MHQRRPVARCGTRWKCKRHWSIHFAQRTGRSLTSYHIRKSAKPRSVTCIFPNPPDVARPYDFQSAGWFLGVTDITESHPGKPYIASRAVIQLSDTTVLTRWKKGYLR